MTVVFVAVFSWPARTGCPWVARAPGAPLNRAIAAANATTAPNMAEWNRDFMRTPPSVGGQTPTVTGPIEQGSRITSSAVARDRLAPAPRAPSVRVRTPRPGPVVVSGQLTGLLGSRPSGTGYQHTGAISYGKPFVEDDSI